MLYEMLGAKDFRGCRVKFLTFSFGLSLVALSEIQKRMLKTLICGL